jgi:hypothetical protein
MRSTFWKSQWMPEIATLEVRDKLVQAGSSPRSSAPAELDALTHSEYKRLGKVARIARMHVD